MHSKNFADAMISSGKTSAAFYRGYNVSHHVHQGRPMAPNHHPEFHKALATNSRAFYKKTGMNAQHLDNAKNAVSRKSNEMLERSRMNPAGRSSTAVKYITAGTSAQRIF